MKVSKLLPFAYLLCRQASAMSLNMDIQRFQNLSWCKPDWPLPSVSKAAVDLLRQCKTLPQVEVSDNMDDVIERSEAFPINFPIDSVRLQQLKARRPLDKLKKNVESTYAVMHERVLLLMAQFLIYKREHGSDIEKALYKEMSIADLIDRILKKRAVVFMGPEDSYQLLDGIEGDGGWEEVGTPSQRSPLLLGNCLSYDEMKLSSMVYVSGHTACINDGNRYNRGDVDEGNAEMDAVIIGIIGPRFERENRMEYEDILITEDQNIVGNGYGKSESARQKWRQMWADFYQVENQTYETLKTSLNIPNNQTEEQKYQDRYVSISSGMIFDNEVYYKRLRVIVESVLLEAQARAFEEGKSAFVNVIGAGLGVWKISHHQADVFVLTFLERIRAMLTRGVINCVSDVNFGYIRPSLGVLGLFSSAPSPDGTPGKVKKLFFEGKSHPSGGINVQLENREPSAKLKGEHEGKLLVMTYPWDGNAQPGNEFWTGSLDGSGDPAAASSTQVAELHNAHINLRLNGSNARVATGTGIVGLRDYCSTVN